ncbi:MAG: hypothetical protein U0835_00110 [Isosphaeraceae bacterium]
MTLLDGLTSLNNPRSAPGLARSPRPVVRLNDAPLSGVVEVEVTNNAHFTADTYRVLLAVAGLPARNRPRLLVRIPGRQDIDRHLARRRDADAALVGQVDDVEWDPTGTRITLTGRDLSAALIDARTAEKFQNRTASQIAQELALRHGLDSAVQATETNAGTYYEIDHAEVTHEMTEWDLLAYLAEREGFDAWVAGTTLHFEPPPAEAGEPYVLLWSEPGDGTRASNATSLHLRRSQTLARDGVVTVRSWNQKQQAAFTVTARRPQAKKSQRRGGTSQTFSFVRPNLTRDQAQQFAEAKAEEITRHERVLSASLPGDNALTTRTTIRLVGTGTDWDQVYYPDAVTRRLSMQEGYRMEVRAKNHSVQDQVLA